jgi:hypothetical protein
VLKLIQSESKVLKDISMHLNMVGRMRIRTPVTEASGDITRRERAREMWEDGGRNLKQEPFDTPTCTGWCAVR